jgi:hypothetical protein
MNSVIISSNLSSERFNSLSAHLGADNPIIKNLKDYKNLNGVKYSYIFSLAAPSLELNSGASRRVDWMCLLQK